ncbi:MAG: sodium:proton antiporter [Planctomycetota bacterium]|nr:sodium:proton antiporter [Planctomycetota bacterium]
MDLFQVISVVLVLAAAAAYINDRFLKMPSAIGVMLAAASFSLVLLLLDAIGAMDDTWAVNMIQGIDFKEVVFKGLLCFLLFAATMQTDSDLLSKSRWSILYLSTVGVVLSALICGTLLWFIANALGVSLPWIGAMVFGALIAPTDPVAITSILKKSAIRQQVKSPIIGEAMFNDAAAIVLFYLVAHLSITGADFSAVSVTVMFCWQLVGGIALGVMLGWLGQYLLSTVTSASVCVLITVGLVFGGSTLAETIRVSGPTAMVVAGLIVAAKRGFTEADRSHPVVNFWSVIDVGLNAVLFVLIGLELLLIAFNWPAFLSGLVAIPIVVLARYLSLVIPWFSINRQKWLPHSTLMLMTWIGLRGGVSIALALTISRKSEFRQDFIIMTFVVVIFSLFVQGFTVPTIAKHDKRRITRHDATTT